MSEFRVCGGCFILDSFLVLFWLGCFVWMGIRAFCMQAWVGVFGCRRPGK